MKKLLALLGRAMPAIKSAAIDLVGVAGAGAIATGVAYIYRPAGLIVAGLFLLAAALLLGRRG